LLNRLNTKNVDNSNHKLINHIIALGGAGRRMWFFLLSWQTTEVITIPSASLRRAHSQSSFGKKRMQQISLVSHGIIGMATSTSQAQFHVELPPPSTLTKAI